VWACRPFAVLLWAVEAGAPHSRLLLPAILVLCKTCWHEAKVCGGPVAVVAEEDIVSPPPVRKAYAFVCRGCAHVWHGVFEVRQIVDAQGAKLAVFLQDGVQVPSPETESACPLCEGRSVRVLTPGKVMRPDAGRA
jgi:hypothetical protein